MRLRPTLALAGALAGCLSIPERDFPAFSDLTDASGGGVAQPGGAATGGTPPGIDMRTGRADARIDPDDGVPPDAQRPRLDARVDLDDGVPQDARLPVADARIDPDDGVPQDARRPILDARIDPDDGVPLDARPPALDARPPGPDAGPDPDDGVRPDAAPPCVPREEVCNGADEDCDGSADEGVADRGCYEGAEGTLNVGRCRGGLNRCVGGQFTGCEGQVVPAPETCDASDEDCDGRVDNDVGGCDCRGGEHRGCYTGPDGTAGQGECRSGEQQCDPQSNRYGPCENEVRPTTEICNDRDDDCNGRTDDGIPDVGEGCSNDRNGCRERGVTQCDGRRERLYCDAPEPQGEPERCDGADNDCDGNADEGFPLGAPCSLGIGACNRVSIVVCVPGGGTDCLVPPGPPSEEICNGQDDDCNGLTDERDPQLGQGCDTGLGGFPCSNGALDCVGGGLRCEPFRESEQCDFVDNDCDGAVDEGFDANCIPP